MIEIDVADFYDFLWLEPLYYYSAKHCSFCALGLNYWRQIVNCDTVTLREAAEISRGFLLYSTQDRAHIGAILLVPGIYILA